MSTPWGPFMPGLEASEQKARLRALRLSVKLLTGARGHEATVALVRAEISGGDADLLDEAETEFEKLAPLDRRRVLSVYQVVA